MESKSHPKSLATRLQTPLNLSFFFLCYPRLPFGESSSSSKDTDVSPTHSDSDDTVFFDVLLHLTHPDPVP